MRICLVLEGSYPYITGGVSAWVHDLIVNLPEIDFVLFTISPNREQTVKYKLPDNISEHRNIIVSEQMPSKSKPDKKKKMLEHIRQLHTSFKNNSSQGLEELLNHIPENYFLYKDAIKSPTGWDMITEANQRFNPIYPFVDYFWAWKSAHDMLFTVLGAPAPEADIYHSVSTGFAGLAALAAKIRKGKPFLLTEHGLYHKERDMEIRKSNYIRGYQRDMWIKMYNQFSRICYEKADIITALFETNRLHQIDAGASPEKTKVIPNGIDIERFSSVERKEEPGFHVGLVGRVVPIKDIKTFIATAKIVIDRIPDVYFYCIGPTDEDPGYFKDCKLLVESLKIQDNFFFTGKQNVLEYYSFLNLLMLTSVREAQPLVILEGYAAGIPAVATNVGNIPELLDHNQKLLAPPKDSTNLAEGIIYLYEHPAEVRDLVEKNKRKVDMFYNKYELHRRYRELYKSIIGGT